MSLQQTLRTRRASKKTFLFQSFFFDNLAFQTNFPASGQVSREELLQAAACREQLYPARKRSLHRTTSNNLLSNSKCQQATLQQLGSAECRQSKLHIETFPQLPLKEPLGRKNFFTESFQKHSLKTDLLQEHLCREQLAEKNFYHTSFYNNNFPEETFTKTASQTAA